MADVQDAPPKTQDDQEKKEEELPAPNNAWKVYLQPRWLTKILTDNQCLFGSFIGIGYILMMCGYISSANFYSDADRLIPCSYQGPLRNSDASSAVLDTPILLIGIFHLI